MWRTELMFWALLRCRLIATSATSSMLGQLFMMADSTTCLFAAYDPLNPALALYYGANPDFVYVITDMRGRRSGPVIKLTKSRHTPRPFFMC